MRVIGIVAHRALVVEMAPPIAVGPDAHVAAGAALQIAMAGIVAAAIAHAAFAVPGAVAIAMRAAAITARRTRIAIAVDRGFGLALVPDVAAAAARIMMAVPGIMPIAVARAAIAMRLGGPRARLADGPADRRRAMAGHDHALRRGFVARPPVAAGKGNTGQKAEEQRKFAHDAMSRMMAHCGAGARARPGRFRDVVNPRKGCCGLPSWPGLTRPPISRASASDRVTGAPTRA